MMKMQNTTSLRKGNRLISALLVFCILLAACATTAFAAGTEEQPKGRLAQAISSREDRRERRDALKEPWDALSKEEKAALKDGLKAKRTELEETWDAMTDEEKAARKAEGKAKLNDLKAQWDDLTDEEKTELKDKALAKLQEKLNLK